MTQKNKLKRGFTTGASAAAAAKGALYCLLFDIPLASVDIQSLTHEPITVPVHRVASSAKNRAECVVIKDAGDDPDVTHQAEIGARVEWYESRSTNISFSSMADIAIEIRGGEGVGRVTKPGLEVPPGQPAINPGPMKMIRQAVMEVVELFYNQKDGKKTTGVLNAVAGNPGLESARSVAVVENKNIRQDETGERTGKENIGRRTENLPVKILPEKIIVDVFVPAGEILAEKTLNARLGILGGISILGTTGIVKPMSHDAYIATIKSGISVAEAMGDDTLVFTTGRRSERFAMDLFPHLKEEAFVQTGDFFKASLEAAANASTMRRVIITVFFGKAVKMAMGFPHTHAAKSELTLKKLAVWASEITYNETLSRNIAVSNTARHAFTYIHPDFPELITHVGRMIIRSAEKFSRNQVKIDAVIFDFEGNRVFDSTRECS